MILSIGGSSFLDCDIYPLCLEAHLTSLEDLTEQETDITFSVNWI